jgi:hypothetical protein
VFQIQDDGPVANTLTKSIVSEGVNTNLMVILDISGSMDEPSGMTDLDKIQAAIASVKELIEQYDALGDVKVRICTFSTGATEVGAVWMTVAEAKTFLNTLLDDDGSTNYDAGADRGHGRLPGYRQDRRRAERCLLPVGRQSKPAGRQPRHQWCRGDGVDRLPQGQ